jgi:hypothetical protein
MSNNTYPKKKINGKTFILCRNSNAESPYFKGTICQEWVPINPDSIAAVCNKCVIENQRGFN